MSTATAPKSQNIFWHKPSVARTDRETLNKHKGVLLWYTGLSGSGKSTLANQVSGALHAQGCRTYVLDGDNIRHGLNKDLGFSPADRTENIRRIGEVGKLFVDAGAVVSTAFISPYRADRDQIRAILAAGDFVEIFVKCTLEACEKRDTKGLYKKAREGVIKEFTGISAPYEEPVKPELVIETDKESAEASSQKVLAYLTQRKLIG